MEADLLDFAMTEFADVVSGRKIFTTVARSVGGQTLRKQLGGGRTKLSASIVFPTKSAKQPVLREGIVLQTFLTNYVK